MQSLSRKDKRSSPRNEGRNFAEEIRIQQQEQFIRNHSGKTEVRTAVTQREHQCCLKTNGISFLLLCHSNFVIKDENKRNAVQLGVELKQKEAYHKRLGTVQKDIKDGVTCSERT